ncbi:hypothetical protein [Bacillus tropicus]|uniref:hypothetical protein n=1 Tax=Bacillus tropicus TaxID=2026188 RepID=UPI0013D6FFA0|nr:hypothetical protein [Bacillus tropicus]
MNTITTVSTKDELEYAIKNKFAKIICTGDIAEKVNRSYKMKTVSKFALPTLAVAIAAIPITAGASSVALLSAATIGGLDFIVIMAIVFLGYSLVKQIINKYDKVSVNTNPDGGVEVVLEMK